MDASAEYRHAPATLQTEPRRESFFNHAARRTILHMFLLHKQF